MSTSWVGALSRADLGPVSVVAGGFSFPTSLAFDSDANAYVAESGLPFGKAAPGGRVWKVTRSGEKSLLADGFGHPVTGLVFHDNALWVSQGSNPGRIDRLELDGTISNVLDGLPGGGNYHTNMVAFGPDGKMYWGQGAMTNTGIVGLDALAMGWLKRLPHSVDIPGYEIVLNDIRVETRNPFSDDPEATLVTGPYSQFGETVKQGTRLAAQVPATSAVLRANPDGTNIELVAWGIRNAFGLGFLPDGRLLAIDQGADDRGSRPVANVPDFLVEVKPGAWYGWPDFMGDTPITDPRFVPETGEPPTFILANHNELPASEKPLVEFVSHSAATRFAADPRENGELLAVALFGDETPMTATPGSPVVGRAIVLVRTCDWQQHVLTTTRIQRPIDIQFNPVDGTMWVLDFGAFEMEQGSSGIEVVADSSSGCIWRVENRQFFPVE